ncbi:unnamed protein product [Caenorhabditis sp. 36 PRJEB53466]|nr:unnamed protein product [Caenorhabditis sp. 36 PRJEB53466]
MPETAAGKVEVPLNFQGGLVTIHDASLIKKSTILVRAIAGSDDDWEENGLVLKEPIDIPFPKAAGEFLFAHAHDYVEPSKLGRTATMADYPGAEEIDVNLAKEIIELANYLEFAEFLNCMGFVIARKIDKMAIKDIAELFGLEYLETDPNYDVDDAWIHPHIE